MRIIYLWIEEGAKDRDGSSKSINGLYRRVEDDDGGDNDGYSLHCIPNAKSQWRNLIKWHVWNLIIQVIENTLRRYPPASIFREISISNSSENEQIIENNRVYESNSSQAN